MIFKILYRCKKALWVPIRSSISKYTIVDSRNDFILQLVNGKQIGTVDRLFVLDLSDGRTLSPQGTKICDMTHHPYGPRTPRP
jgi:hypothetical protein